VDVPACHVWLSEGINQYSVDIPYDNRSIPSNPGSHPISVYFNYLQSAFVFPIFQNHPKLITFLYIYPIYIILYPFKSIYIAFISAISFLSHRSFSLVKHGIAATDPPNFFRPRSRCRGGACFLVAAWGWYLKLGVQNDVCIHILYIYMYVCISNIYIYIYTYICTKNQSISYWSRNIP